MKEVSLYIPCFNAAKTIQPCLEAVFKQSRPLKEIVIVDDGSTDETQDIVSRYPVRLIKCINNKGLATARNTAVKNIDTEFIASLDADCVPDADWLKTLMQRFDSPKIAGVGGKLFETYSSTAFDLWRSVHMKQYWEDRQIKPPFLFGSNTVFRKDALMSIGFYKEVYNNNYEDVDLCARIKKAGYLLIYEPKAKTFHLKTDNIYTLLDTYWKWHIGYYQKKRWYSNQRNFKLKLKDNIGLANRYIEEDITFHRDRLLYLDFLLALHHSFRDFEYFVLQDNKKTAHNSEYLPLPQWLSLLDLTFFYHFDFKKKKQSTLMHRENALLQNFMALNLILGKSILDMFKNRDSQKILYKHLFLSINKINDSALLDKLLDLIERHHNWDELFKKNQPNLNNTFLENLFLYFQEWGKSLVRHFPNIIQKIEVSAENTEDISS